MKRLLDPSFVYVNAFNTDIRKTFERIRRELNGPKKQDQSNVRQWVPVPVKPTTKE